MGFEGVCGRRDGEPLLSCGHAGEALTIPDGIREVFIELVGQVGFGVQQFEL